MSNTKVVVVGGGWAGCAAALQAAKSGAKVTLLERTDMLLGTGLVGGIMRNNGRFTATEELIAMGGGDLFLLCDANARHKNVEFPQHKHATLYDIKFIPQAVYNYLKENGVDIQFKKRIIEAKIKNNRINYISDSKEVYESDVFIDATGTAGPMNNCSKYGNGCAMCILRCPSFGGRKSLAGACGLKEAIARKKDNTVGAMSGSCKLLKESLSEELQHILNTKGVAIVKIPQELIEDKTGLKACQQYASKEFTENIILLDTGHAKLMSPYFELERLHKIPGLEQARYEDPYAGGIGNSMRYFDMCSHDDYLRVLGVDNLFCCGEKVGPLVGHTEAIVTGTLAGYNSVHTAEDKMLLYPESLSVGDIMAYLKETLKTEDGLTQKITFSGAAYFKRMTEKGLYLQDTAEIEKRVYEAGVKDIFSMR